MENEEEEGKGGVITAKLGNIVEAPATTHCPQWEVGQGRKANNIKVWREAKMKVTITQIDHLVCVELSARISKHLSTHKHTVILGVEHGLRNSSMSNRSLSTTDPEHQARPSCWADSALCLSAWGAAACFHCKHGILCNLPFAICPWQGVQSHLLPVTEICYAFSVIINAFSWWSFLRPHMFHCCKQQCQRVLERQRSASPLPFGGLRDHTMHTYTIPLCGIRTSPRIPPGFIAARVSSNLHNRWSFPNNSNMRLCDTWKRDS